MSTPRARTAPATPGPVPTSEALVIRTFGRAEVLVGGAEAAWPSASARELLFYLLSRPEGATKAEILEELWGLEDDAASANRFRVTAHRLRATLGWSGAMTEAYGRYHLAPEVFRASDVQQVHAALHEAQTTEDAAGRLRAYRRVLAVYAGEYLPHVREDWAERAREEHRAAYVRACVEVSLVHCERSDCEGAVGALVRALRADPFIGENYHQKLMTCLSVVEGRYAAIEHYRRFIRFLREDLSDTPMPETVGLAERIKCGEQICRRPQGAATLPAHLCALTTGGDCPAPLAEVLNLN
ncbi:AfsR/SARP family transcriptional regulator [Deinococcus pimensis]|uniref:AfsR/SARP family transcriptional regulator n=1 Tax=Deinococcus pimensis TaxID=309888 RepID=UPI0004B7509C|nr:BTAD domain-containing putative transcriptional regulator [Deinococcus pimensis]